MKNYTSLPTYRPTDLPTYRPTDLPTYRLKQVLLPARLLLIMLAVLFIFTGCEKEKHIVSSDLQKDATSEKFKVENGELHFVDAETFRKDAIEIMNLPEPEFHAWEESIGFKSLGSWVKEAYQELDKTRTEAELANWKEEYGDIMEIRDNEVRSIIQDSYALAFANRAGVFHIGQKLVQAYRIKNVIILDGDRSKLPEARLMNASDLGKGIVIDVHPIPDQVDLRSGCVSLETERIDGGRRVVYRFKIDDKSFSSDIYTQVEIAVFAKRKNVWGNWVTDYQQLRWEECSWQVTDNNSVNHTVTNQTVHSGNDDVAYIKLFYNLNDYTPASSYVLPNFNYRKGKATSNHLEWNKWAVQCCGFPSSQCPDADGL